MGTIDDINMYQQEIRSLHHDHHDHHTTIVESNCWLDVPWASHLGRYHLVPFSQELQRAFRDRGLGRYLTSCHVDTIDGYQALRLVIFECTVYRGMPTKKDRPSHILRMGGSEC